MDPVDHPDHVIEEHELPELDDEPGLTCFVFGPGTGESIAVRVAGDAGPRWLVVDCCVVEPGGVAPAEQLIDYYGEDLTHLLITHRHEDHVMGAPMLLDQLAQSPHDEASLIVADDHADIGAAIARGSDSRTEVVLRNVEQALLALDEAPRRGINTIIAHRGMPQHIGVGDAVMTVVSPEHPPPAPIVPGQANAWSIVAQLRWRGYGVLLTGDAPARTLRQIPGASLDQHTVCKVPHHGSHGSIDACWTGAAESADRSRRWFVTPYSSCSLPRLGETKQPPHPSLTMFVDELRLTALPVRDSFRLVDAPDLTAAAYAEAVADRKRGVEALRASTEAARHWSDAMWWIHLPGSDDAAPDTGRGRSTILIR